ncbi:unnamed protein product [Acanthoscelides obtectus]|uniref:Peptidase M14 domain-containing protein n=1 Tax=Acanthoscelides obtectus TaxID=200917 RepID=A0A9P0L4S8_ACAOB|nr:unnamed protein product [Acanthoscelides obtectus]CAK1663269.1 Zinc carboxypeptidase A 1 [Acanthoscelides obtectus]
MRLLWFLLLGICSAVPKRFDNYAILRITPQSEEALIFLRSFEKYENVEFFTPLTKVDQTAEVLLPPQYQDVFLEQQRGLDHDVDVVVAVKNVQEVIEEGVRPADKAESFDWSYFYPLEDIQSWITGLAEEYSDKVEVSNIKTYENRDLSIVKVSFNPKATKVVFIEAGMHAREWISPAVATYILNEIIHSTDAEIEELRNKFNWYVAPVTNPDGYVYSFEKDRMWRRTRTRLPGSDCIGIDANRNWDFHFNEDGHTSCGQTYPGPYPFSDICTRGLSQFLLNLPEKLQSYISLHSFGAKILIPYGNSTEHLDNYDEVYKIAEGAAKALEGVNGNHFEIGTALEVMKQGSESKLNIV